MTLLRWPFSSSVGILSLVGFSAITLLASPANAQHRARVARGLETKLVSGSTAPVQVLVTAPQAEIDRLIRTYGVRVKQRLEMGALLEGTGGELKSVAEDSLVGAVSANEVVTSTMAVTTQSTGANLLWGKGPRNFGGLTGSGIGIAIIDSGVGSHPDVAGRLRLSMDFTEGDEGVADGYGHGTHIAGIIAGSGGGSRSRAGSEYVGMAPGAELISLKVLGPDGTGYVSDVIEAIEWAIANRYRYRIRILNLSLGHFPTSEYRDDPMAQAVERAVAAGLVVVASAGNLGKSADGTPIIGAVVSPGFTPNALTVGALNTKNTIARSDDGVATYSSRGPVGDPDDKSTWELKPDLVAPGNAIAAAGLPGTYLYDNFPERRREGSNGGTYLALSGSSMATAVVSGAVAQLLQAQPRLTPAEVKFALQFTAERVDGFGLIEQGAGSLNVPLAAALVETRGGTASPASVFIAGELVESGKLAFIGTNAASRELSRGEGIVWGDTIIWGNRLALGNTNVWGTTIIWGNRKDVGGDTIIWGNRGASTASDGLVWGSTIIWGNRGVSGNTIIWGNRGGGVSGDTIIWGNRGGGVSGDTIIWGNRGGLPSILWGDTIIWGNRNGGLQADTIIWGNRGGQPSSQPVSADTIIWGNRGVTGDTIIWGNRGAVSADTIIWGNRGGASSPVEGNTIIWGNR